MDHRFGDVPPEWAFKSPLGHSNSPYAPISGHARTSPGRRLPPAPGDRRFPCSLLPESGPLILTAFSIRPALDVVLNPQSTAQKLTLFQIPWNGHTVYLNSFVPARIRHVWSVFARSRSFHCFS